MRARFRLRRSRTFSRDDDWKKTIAVASYNVLAIRRPLGELHLTAALTMSMTRERCSEVILIAEPGHVDLAGWVERSDSYQRPSPRRWTSQALNPILRAFVIPGQPAGLSPESMTPAPAFADKRGYRVIDSGLALRAPRNDET